MGKMLGDGLEREALFCREDGQETLSRRGTMSGKLIAERRKCQFISLHRIQPLSPLQELLILNVHDRYAYWRDVKQRLSRQLTSLVDERPPHRWRTTPA